MADGRQQHDWAIASHLMWIQVATNPHVKKGMRSKQPDFFNPLRQKPAVTKVGIDVLKDVFIKKKAPEATK